MPRIEEAQEILKSLGLPPAQQNDMAALTLLALCGIGPENSWKESYRHSLTVTKGIMDFVAREYGRPYAPNTRETFRRQVLHQFVQAQIADYNPDNPNLPTNSPRAHYALSETALNTVRTYGTRKWKSELKRFHSQQVTLVDRYQKQREHHQIPVRLSNGSELALSPGPHNILQAAIIHEFAPRFAPGATLLYLGDTAKKNLFMDEGGLAAAGLLQDKHGKLPDIILYDTKRNWLFLVEAVTDHGPMTPKRVMELETMLAGSSAGRIYVTAFIDISSYLRFASSIAWDTEVWFADTPDHMIHFNGDRFLGPR
jgi:hypothetical protein